LPPAVELTAHRAAHLDPGALRLEIFEWCPGQDHPRSVDLRDFGNVQTHLVMRRRSEALVERHRERIQTLLGELDERVDVMADSSGSFLSLRILGLEIARVEGMLAPKIFFGLEGEFRPLDPGRPEEFRDFAARVLDVRKAQTRDRAVPARGLLHTPVACARVAPLVSRLARIPVPFNHRPPDPILCSRN